VSIFKIRGFPVHSHTAICGAEVRLHPFQPPALDVGDQPHAPATSHPQKAALVPNEYDWLGPTAGLEILEKRKIMRWPWRVSIPVTDVIRNEAYWSVVQVTWLCPP
jgi:hypothetical protein